MNQNRRGLLQAVLDITRNNPAVCLPVDQMETHAAKFIKMLDSLEGAVSGGDDTKTKNLVQVILSSFSAKLVCLTLVYDNKKPLGKGQRLPDLAASLNLFRHINEPAFMWLEPKACGGVRPLISFGTRRKAAQLLCSLVLAELLPQWSFNYLRKGMGIEKACKKLETLAKEENHEWFVIADVKDCYQSLKLESVLKQLPLPEDVVRNVVYISRQTVLNLDSTTPASEYDMWRQVGRTGLPQGSPTSGLIASWLVGNLLSGIGAPDKAILYGDDIAMAARDEAEAMAIKYALLGAADNCLCGPLAFKHIKHLNVEQGLNYTKYRLRRLNNTEKSVFAMSPSSTSWRRFRQRYAERHINNKDPEAYAKNWIDAFPLWERNEQSDNLFEITKYEAVVGLKP